MEFPPLTQPSSNYEPLVEVIACALEKFAAMSEPVAAALARQIAISAAELGHGGSHYYLPQLHTLTRAERDEQIRREFNGRNLSDVCRRYRVSRRTVYRIVRLGARGED